jgi:hypothetical protein
MLFLREFELVDVYRLWDAIFSEYTLTKNLDFIDMIAVAMIKHIKGQLMHQDDSAFALQKLLKFPELSSINGLLMASYDYKRKLL